MKSINSNQEDFEMAQYIYKVLSSKFFIMCSWGFNNPISITDGLQFSTNGFIHKGTVQVVYIHGLDLFEVRLLEEINLIKTISGIYVDELVATIDDNVENVSDYKMMVNNEYDLDKTHSNDDCIQINLN